jgi:hypothetical protein
MEEISNIVLPTLTTRLRMWQIHRIRVCTPLAESGLSISIEDIIVSLFEALSHTCPRIYGRLNEYQLYRYKEMFANLFIYSKFSKASVQLISKVISRMALFKAELNENIYTSKYREMPNLRYEVQKERLERPFASSMNNYPKK